MYPDPAPALVLWGIPGIAAAVLTAVLWLVWRAGRLTGTPTRGAWVFAACWVALVSGAAASGVLARFDARPPPLAALMVFTIAGALWVGTSHRTAFVPKATPIVWLVGLQAFRLPLELVMHQAAHAGVMPVQLSFEGFNFDIVTGTTALVLAPFADRVPRAVLVAWNALGAACLLVIGWIAIATAPFVAAFGPGSVNRWVAWIPFVYLPAVLVFVAIAGHCWVARWLRAHPPGTSGAP